MSSEHGENLVKSIVEQEKRRSQTLLAPKPPNVPKTVKALARSAFDWPPHSAVSHPALRAFLISTRGVVVFS